MSSRRHTVLGWAVWQVAKRKLKQNRVKLGAGATVAAVLVVGLLAAKADADGR